MGDEHGVKQGKRARASNKSDRHGDGYRSSWFLSWRRSCDFIWRLADWDDWRLEPLYLHRIRHFGMEYDFLLLHSGVLFQRVAVWVLCQAEIDISEYINELCRIEPGLG